MYWVRSPPRARERVCRATSRGKCTGIFLVYTFHLITSTSKRNGRKIIREKVRLVLWAPCACESGALDPQLQRDRLGFVEWLVACEEVDRANVCVRKAERGGEQVDDSGRLGKDADGFRYTRPSRTRSNGRRERRFASDGLATMKRIAQGNWSKRVDSRVRAKTVQIALHRSRRLVFYMNNT